MSMRLPVGEHPARPPATAVDLFADDSGNVNKIDSAGVVTPVGGGGGVSDLRAAIMAFAVSQYPTLNRCIETEVLAPTIDYGTQVLGPNNGTQTQTQAVKGGVTQLATSAAGAGGIVLHRLGQATSVVSINALTDVPWFCAAIATMPATIDANSQCALNFETITFSTAAGFGIFGSASTAFYSMVIGATSRVGTVAVDLSGAYVLLMEGFDGTTVKGWVSTPAGILTTEPTLAVSETVLANVTTSPCNGMFTLHQNSAVASKTSRVDYLFEAWAGAV